MSEREGTALDLIDGKSGGVLGREVLKEKPRLFGGSGRAGLILGEGVKWDER
jgi:hypothetical protein